MKEIRECTHFLSKNQKTFDKGGESTVLQNEKRKKGMHSFPLGVKPQWKGTEMHSFE